MAQIVNNALEWANNSAVQVVRNGTDLDTTDMLHEIEVVEINRASAAERSGGPGIRYQNSSNYLFCILKDDNTQDELELGKITGGSLTVLSSVNATAANGDTVELRGIDDQLTCRHNGTLVLGPTTETDHDGQLRVNVRFEGAGSDASSIVRLDNSHATNTIPPDASPSFGPRRRRVM